MNLVLSEVDGQLFGISEDEDMEEAWFVEAWIWIHVAKWDVFCAVRTVVGNVIEFRYVFRHLSPYKKKEENPCKTGPPLGVRASA
jgi:hypothetical protein